MKNPGEKKIETAFNTDSRHGKYRKTENAWQIDPAETPR